MDHFNITVQDGAMVSTRRGFKVSKQKHNGTAFINSSASNIVPGKKESGAGSLLPTAGELTFVNNGGDGRRSRRKTRPTSHDGRQTGSRSLGARETAQSRLSPDARLSSSSPRTTVSENLNTQYASSTASANSPSNTESTQLPPWAAYSHSQAYTEPTKRLRFMALAFGNVRTVYNEEQQPPAGVRPVEMMQRSTWQIHDPTTIHCALTMGALFDAVKEGKHDTPQLTALASQLYSIVNRRVSENDRTDNARDVTIRAVASLAIISGYQAKSEHWYVHMRGLQNLVDIAGGQEKLFPGTLDMIRCADVTGAISAAKIPCTSFFGLPCRSRHVSRLEDTGSTTRGAVRLLDVFRFDPETTKSLTATAKFCEDHAGNQDQDATSLQTHTSEILVDFHYLCHRLLSRPQPLQDWDNITSSSTSTNLSPQSQNFSTAGSRTMSPAETTTKAVELTLRILAIMYLKEIMLDIPCNDNILLETMARQLLFILSGQRSNVFRPDQTPLLIWICLAGQVFEIRNKATWHREPARYHGAYAQLLVEILTAEEGTNTDKIPADKFAFCRCFDLRRIQGVMWDEREAIKGILEMTKNQ